MFHRQLDWQGAAAAELHEQWDDTTDNNTVDREMKNNVGKFTNTKLKN
jgi:hypothetical protein